MTNHHSPPFDHQSGGAYVSPQADAVDAQVLDGGRRGYVVFAWVVILVVTSFIAYRQMTTNQAAARNEGASRFAIQMMEVQGKYIVAVAGSFGVDHEQAYEQSKPLNQGPVDFRIRYAVLAGELSGPSEALKHLRELRRLMEQHGRPPDSTQQRLIAILEALYADYQKSAWGGSSLSADDRDVLKGELGWFGLLALGPRRGDQPAAKSDERRQAMADAGRVLTVVLTGFLLGFFAFGGGFVGAIVFFVLLLLGKLRSYLEAGSRFGGVYAETFAVWMILYLGLGFAVALLPLQIDRLLLSGIVSLLTLIATLCWPLVRGVSLRQLFRDIGIVVPQGRRAYLEPFWGLVSYICALPLLALGLIFTAILVSAFGRLGDGGDEFSTPNAPTHPITEMIGDGGTLIWLKLFFLAAVVAPIVEEIVFRGVLYRHLRDATAKWRIAVSVLISGTISSFVFAIIHPQGIFGVPVLMSLAFTFCLAREWRGSIVAPITMHAINNGVVTLTLLLLLSI